MCDNGEHEFVGMDMRIYCHEPKQLLLQTQFFKDAKGEMKPRRGIRKYQSTSPEPCDKCKKKFEEDGVVPDFNSPIGKPKRKSLKSYFGTKWDGKPCQEDHWD